MRINPKDYVLDDNERFILRQALELYANAQVRMGARFTNDSDAAKRRKDDAEMRLARAQDLLEKLA